MLSVQLVQETVNTLITAFAQKIDQEMPMNGSRCGTVTWA
jgi:hypothetical protein